ncbi:hypothetical protein SAMD00019534_022650 [Acytostelium subglobosum LB1]|uniref:hypothetical protein n=1 Tax=Acytostelium subglobosum LB1 TaxID=1410327 RepID=UPI000644C2FF|nr:hypothetical protein SAMD00019534_022650 [Acytostelium subglobosum LB1]GAM19090.1 hypothetical protein SAMD00019534_022650 [Acytostelium subglobosum LB1]|eukprot:XP_012757017.1 hypothetical protein SAMD00019534_022650 [Acytostelium subglobosum LB1]
MTTETTAVDVPSPAQGIDYKTWHSGFAIKVMSHPINGRYIVATKDIEHTTVILRDLPYVWAVDMTSKHFVCQQCFLEVPVEEQHGENPEYFAMCDKCQFVGYCSEECREIDSLQHNLECAIFAHFDTTDYTDSLISEIKLLVRTLSRKWLEQSLKETEGSLYHKYKSVTPVPQENGLRYKDYEQLVSNINAFSPALKESLLHWICDKVIAVMKKHTGRRENDVDLLNVILRNRCNAFYIQGRPRTGGNGESRGCGVYVRNSFFNHSCNPNVNYWVVDNSLEVECSVTRAVKEGEELCISYIDTTVPLVERREKLSEGYLFHCRCEKCLEDEARPPGFEQSAESQQAAGETTQEEQQQEQEKEQMDCPDTSVADQTQA